MKMIEHMKNSKRVEIIIGLPRSIMMKCSIVMINDVTFCAKSRYSYFDKGKILETNPESFNEEFLNQELDIIEIDFNDIKTFPYEYGNQFLKFNLLIKNVPSKYLIVKEMN